MRGAGENRRYKFSCRRQDEGRASVGALQGPGHAERSRPAEWLQDLGRRRGRCRGLCQGWCDGGVGRKDDGTLLTYDVEAQIGGKLAQLGQRLINGAAKKLADEFFTNFAKAVQG